MRHLTWLLSASLLLLSVTAHAAPKRPPVTFFGFDYSTTKMYGTLDFNEPAEIFPGYLDKWNALWLTEMVETTEKAIGPVVWSFESVTPLNATATADQIIRQDGGPELVEATELDEAAIGSHLTKLDVKDHTGLGLLVIVDRLVKSRETGCAVLVYFDIASRTPKVSARVCERATGFGFRNYWFRPLKDMVDDMKRLRPDG